jgi:hypothetical protein
VVHESVKLIRQRSGSAAVAIRPWLQDFKDYAFDKRIFGVTEIRAQVKGSDDAGGAGWMLWNPRNDYTAAALRPKGVTASADRVEPGEKAAPPKASASVPASANSTR